MPYSLENKRPLVTGGSRGIGAAIFKRLAREGAREASRPSQLRFGLQPATTDDAVPLAALHTAVADCLTSRHGRGP